MRYDLYNIRCWLCCGLVYFFSFVGVGASTSFSLSGTNDNLTYSASGSVSKVESSPGNWFLVGTVTFTSHHASWPDSSGYASTFCSFVGSQVSNTNNPIYSGTGGMVTKSINVPCGALTENVRVWAGTGYNSNGYVYQDIVLGPDCPDVAYSYYLSGDSVLGTRYIVFTEPASGVPGVILWEGTVGYGATELVSGTAAALCGTIRVQKYNAQGGENPWQDYSPLPGPPAPPPEGPPGPNPLPPPPDVPDSPSGGITPDTPPVPAPPPTGGGGGDGEIIEWVKDTNAVNRGISDRVDNSNEYLRQIRDNTGYAADRLKKIDENTQTIADDVKRKEAVEQAIKDATPDSAEMQQAGAAAVAALQEAMGTVTTGSPLPSGMQAPDFVITMPAMMGGGAFDLNPFREDRLGPIVAFLKSLLAWLLVVGWAAWALKIATESGNVVMIAPQAKGNTVVAGTGAQATALVAATLITAIALSSITVIWAAWRDTNLQGLTAAGVLGVNPFSVLSGAAAKVVWMLDQVLPLATIVAVLWARVTFRFYVYAAAYAAVTLKRFIVP